MISEQQAARLLQDIEDKADKPFYVFMDEQENVLRSEWLPNDQYALRFAEFCLNKQIVNVLRYVGSNDAAVEAAKQASAPIDSTGA